MKEAERKENRVFTVIGALEALMKNADFVALLQGEGLTERPHLAGTYSGWQNPASNPTEGSTDDDKATGS